jgi:branched-chain amino acid transport system substrate-binding protein
MAMVAVLGVGGVACGGDEAGETSTPTSQATQEPAAPSGPLKIGTLLPETGSLGFLGPPMIKATEMAAEDINAAGGVNGADVELNQQDDGTDVNVASQAVDTLLADGVSAIVGAAGSPVTLGVIDKIVNAPAVECSPSNTGASLTTYEDKGFYFRTAPPDNLQSIALANAIVSDGFSNIAILNRSDEYGQGLADGVEQALTDTGATIAAAVAYDPKATTFDAEVQQAKDANPDAVVLVAYEEGGQVLKAMIQNGLGPKDTPIYVTDGLQSSELWKSVDPKDEAVLEGVKGTAPSSAPENGEPGFPDRFAEFAPDVDTIYSAHAYDCVMVIALAAEAAKSNAPADIQAQMIPVTLDGTACTSFQECKDLLADGEDIDYNGAAGPLDFVEAGEPGVGTYDVWSFDNKGAVQTESQVVVDPSGVAS